MLVCGHYEEFEHMAHPETVSASIAGISTGLTNGTILRSLSYEIDGNLTGINVLDLRKQRRALTITYSGTTDVTESIVFDKMTTYCVNRE